MTLLVARFFSLFLAALAFGATYAHVMELPGQRALSGSEWLAFQHNFYGGFAITGAIAEIGGLLATLLATLVVLFLVRGRRGAFALTLVATLCPLAMLAFYFVGNAPLNAQIATRTTAALPPAWDQTRDAWSLWHTASAFVACIWLVALLVSTLRDTGPRTTHAETPSSRDPQLVTGHDRL